MLDKNLSKYARAFINILSDLSEQERKILIKRFGERQSMKKVAKEFKLTDARIKDIEDNIIRQIDQIFDYLSF